MTAQAAPVVASTGRLADNLDHYVCCDPNLALCGVDVTHATWSEDLPDLCVVCEDLDEFECERCGE